MSLARAAPVAQVAFKADMPRRLTKSTGLGRNETDATERDGDPHTGRRAQRTGRARACSERARPADCESATCETQGRHKLSLEYPPEKREQDAEYLEALPLQMEAAKQQHKFWSSVLSAESYCLVPPTVRSARFTKRC
eukprot:6178117-Pleurochrysis_carterae.AAC.1